MSGTWFGSYVSESGAITGIWTGSAGTTSEGYLGSMTGSYVSSSKTILGTLTGSAGSTSE